MKTNRWGLAAAVVVVICGGVPGVSVSTTPVVATPDQATHAARATRGLVIGIDEYQTLKDLEGAVNDAHDISDALAGAGVDDLVVLLDETATRERVVEEWQALVARAAPGDTLILTYAGHGGQEPERVSGTEEDGKDETLLLGGFDTTGIGTRERIFDDELNQWFLDAGEKGLRVIFVADSCHSGTATRGVDPRASRPASRYASPYEVQNDLLELRLPVASADTGREGEAELAHVNFLAASPENRTVEEITILDEAGHPRQRGALSYAFARAVRGEADDDGDRVLQWSELRSFVVQQVRRMAESRQKPVAKPNERGEEAVLRLPGAVEIATAAGTDQTTTVAGTGHTVPTTGVGQVTTTAETSGGQPTPPEIVVRLAVMNAAPDVGARVQARYGMSVDTTAGNTIFGTESANDRKIRSSCPRPGRTAPAELPVEPVHIRVEVVRESPDLIWDATARQVVSGLGDVVAHEVGLEELSGVTEKWGAVRAIGKHRASSLELRVIPDDRLHRRGDEIALEVSGLRHPRLTLLNLSGNGVVHYLYPRLHHPAAVSIDRPFRIPRGDGKRLMKVRDPFGADHFVAVSSGSPLLDALNAELCGLHNTSAAKRVMELLMGFAMDSRDWSFGIQGLYTGP